ncbi:MAG: Integrase catalytic region [Candidatus Magasanikbacteria bacterium GW2011_GWA2_45_39]|uniref:Integrase catalytic region n=1 Tax=Candidatus Magasanikbacteria bacterium GW2011_GWA2_45_39 TaxID=1619041 RepID=A0A0G1QEG4_9BACT|nr:MAG: Integrase catalytic region [Candidatus Magasanikbacteria bacterium GW2011_GWA2_45_39]
MNQNQLITMTKTEARKYEIIKDLLAKKIDGSEAAKQLHLSVRQTKRLKVAVIRLGIKGIIHGSRGQKGNRQIDEKIIIKVKKYLKETYYDFNPLLVQEHLRDDYKIILSKETIRQIMITEKLWHPKKKTNIKKHFWRERKDNYGEMQQFDGSYHNWFEGRNEAVVEMEQCLLLSVDDATGKITGAVFEYNEGVVPVFKFWKGYFEAKGRPLAIYLYKFSTYKVNHKNAVDNEELMTQFERAMHQFGVRVIHANSPQAKGRVEKMNGTLQRRLVKEMRLNKINTIETANKFLKETFIPKINKQFAVIPKKENNLHRKLNIVEKNDLDKILSIQTERIVHNDYTVRLKNHYYQLTETQPTTVYKKDKIIIEEHLSGEIKISIRNYYLNYFCLPERPKKEISINLPALTAKPPTKWKPPANHPWRTHFFINKKQPILSAVR